MGTHNTNNFIEINGKRYDAVTGAYLGEQTAALQSAPAVRAAANAPRGQALDGFQRASRGRTVQAQPLRPIPARAAHQAVAVPAPKPRKPHQPGIHAKPHTPQPAKTLMRSAVKKPQIKSPEVIKAQTRTDILARTPSQLVQPKLPHTKVNSKRLNRAERIIQSPAVSKYGQSSSPALPAHLKTPVMAASPAPAQPKSAPLPVRSTLRAPRPGFTPQRAVGQQAMNVVSSATTSPTEKHNNVFEQALAEAGAHHTASKRQRKTRGYGAAATVTAAMLLLVGFIGYQNLPYINVRVAAHKAGIQAKMPSYSPAGFSFGNLSYTPGNVTVSYFSQTDRDQSLLITQESTDWNSKALLENFVTSTSKSYDTIERAGRTIYLYGNNTATWVDNGIWYTIGGKHSLSDTQVLDVAMSL